MSANTYEIKKVWIPLKEHLWEEEDWSVAVPMSNADTDEEWKGASELANEGWELVGAVPITGSKVDFANRFSYSITIAYLLLFRRQIE